jgi:outer membrane protein TolC
MTSEADLMELRAKVAKEVDENYFNYQKAMTSVTASLSKIKFREKDLEINRAKQMMNDEPLSQVLQAELQLGEERVNYVKALADYYESISGLFKAMGLSK